MGQNQDRFEVVIEGDEVRYIDSQSANVPRNSNFRIKLINNSYAESHASVSIDGECIGTWKLGRTSWIDVDIDPRTDREFRMRRRGRYALRVVFEHRIYKEVEEEEVSLDLRVN